MTGGFFFLQKCQFAAVFPIVGRFIIKHTIGNVHYEGTAVQDESIQRVLAERGKTVYATAVRSGAILVDNGNLKLLGDVKVFGR